MKGIYIKGMKMPSLGQKIEVTTDFNDEVIYARFEEDDDNWHEIIPVDELRPTIKGKWNYIFTHQNGEKRFSCSICNTICNAKYDYCPHCGNPMR